MPPLLLASSSPRRRQLLTALGIPFAVDTADIDERSLPGERPIPHALRLAESKTRTVAMRWGQVIVLGVDTIVVQGDAILGKPVDAADARRMLQALREAPHAVITAVAVMQAEALRTAVHASEVVMRPYTDAEMEAYIASGDPFDKAGAYAIQHPVFQPVARFDGCFASIMGLPLGVMTGLLGDAGLFPAEDWPRACAAFCGQCCRS